MNDRDATLSAVRAIVRAYADVDRDDAPIDVESLALVQIAEEIEDRFDLVLSGRDLAPEHFGTVARIAAHVARLLESRP